MTAPEEVVGRRHGHLHDRLEQHRAGRPQRLLDRHGPGDLEGHLRGVHVVVGPVGEGDPDVDRRVAGQDAGGERLLDPGVDRGDVLLGDDAAADLVDELVAAPGPGGLGADDHVAVLAPATGLADVALLDLLDRLADGLAVGHLGLADVGVDRELAAACGRPAPRGAARPCPRSRSGPSPRPSGRGRWGPPRSARRGRGTACPGRPWSWARRPRGSPARGTRGPRARSGAPGRTACHPSWCSSARPRP